MTESEPLLVIDAPAPEPGKLLVRLHAASVLPGADAGDESPTAFGPHATPRFGVAGTVEAIAGCAPGFEVGEAVFGVTCTRPSCEDPLGVVDACRMARKPKRLTFGEAATSALAGTCAWQMLFKIGRLDPGETVLVLGADTLIGDFAIQLAAVHGVRTVAMVMSPGREGELLRRGAHRVIDAGPGRLETHCKLASLVVDTLGGATHHRAAASLQSGCTLVSCVERPDVFTAARRGTRNLFCVPEPTTHCLARIATLIDDRYVMTHAIEAEIGRD